MTLTAPAPPTAPATAPTQEPTRTRGPISTPDLEAAIAEVTAMADDLLPAVEALAERAAYVIAEAQLQMDLAVHTVDDYFPWEGVEDWREVMEEQGTADLYRSVRTLKETLHAGVEGLIGICWTRPDMPWVKQVKQVTAAARPGRFAEHLAALRSQIETRAEALGPITDAEAG